MHYYSSTFIIEVVHSFFLQYFDLSYVYIMGGSHFNVSFDDDEDVKNDVNK